MDSNHYTFDQVRLPHALILTPGQAHIICPAAGEDREAYRVYSVSSSEFYSCRLCERSGRRLLADCSGPGMVTISFRRFSPLPGNMLCNACVHVAVWPTVYQRYK
jgi:hypothetical protein